MEDKHLNVHVTDLKTYMTCARKYYYGSVQNLRRQSTPTAYLAGTYAHVWFEAYYGEFGGEFSGGDAEPESRLENALKAADAWLEAAVLAECATQGDVDRTMVEVELVRSVLRKYEEYEEETQALKAYEVNGKKIIESSFALDSVAGTRLLGKMDMCAVDEYDRIWVVDHKTAKTFPSEDILRLDLQLCAYYVAAEKVLGKPPYGIMFNVVRKQNPETARTPVFKRFSITRNPTEVVNMGKEITNALKALADDRVFLRSPSFMCKACPYKELCIADLEGRDVQELIEAMYVKVEPREDYDGN